MFGSDGAPAITLTQLRVIQDLIEVFDLRGRNTCCGQAGVEYGRSPPAGIRGDDSVAFITDKDMNNRELLTVRDLAVDYAIPESSQRVFRQQKRFIPAYRVGRRLVYRRSSCRRRRTTPSSPGERLRS